MGLFKNTTVDSRETLPIVSKNFDIWYIAMTLYKNVIWFFFHDFHIIFQVDTDSAAFKRWYFPSR